MGENEKFIPLFKKKQIECIIFSILRDESIVYIEGMLPLHNKE